MRVESVGYMYISGLVIRAIPGTFTHVIGLWYLLILKSVV
jgi:hypothetical protein